MKKIAVIVGARPQFIKHAPIEIALKVDFEVISIHTGQHYDDNMSQVFFDDLKINRPNYMLEVGSHSHGKQTGLMLTAIEEILLKESVHGIIVYGDTNSTLAGALAGVKLHIPIFHIEAGLRSFNMKMPEEINRILTDDMSSLLFAPTDQAFENLLKEGKKKEKVIRTGDIMKDMLLIAKSMLNLSKAKNDYYYVTLHRPYNTDEKDRLIEILETLNNLKKRVVFSMHPRTRSKLKNFGVSIESYSNIECIDPMPYFKNIELIHHADSLITDSGGMQKEAYMLKTKCITIRSETEWVETIHDNCNTLIFDDLYKLKEQEEVIAKNFNDKLYGNGNVAEKIVEDIKSFLRP